MTSNRSYRNYHNQEKVKAELRRVVCTQFDSMAVEAMHGIIEADKDYIINNTLTKPNGEYYTIHNKYKSFG